LFTKSLRLAAPSIADNSAYRKYAPFLRRRDEQKAQAYVKGIYHSLSARCLGNEHYDDRERGASEYDPACPRNCAYVARKSFALPFCYEVSGEDLRSRRCEQPDDGNDSKDNFYRNHQAQFTPRRDTCAKWIYHSSSKHKA